jgi:hypothetical protein
MTNTQSLTKKYEVKIEKDQYTGENLYFNNYYYILDLRTRQVVNHIALDEAEAIKRLEELESKGGEYDLLHAVRWISREVK